MAEADHGGINAAYVLRKCGLCKQNTKRVVVVKVDDVVVYVGRCIECDACICSACRGKNIEIDRKACKHCGANLRLRAQ